MDVFHPAKICGTNITCHVRGTCKNGTTDVTAQLYGERVPQNSHGCSVPAVAMRWPPFVINVSAKEEPGMEIYVLQTIAEHFNFVLEFTQVEPNFGRFNALFLSRAGFNPPLINAYLK